MIDRTDALLCAKAALLTRKQSEQLADLLFKAKAVKIASATLGTFSIIGSLYSLARRDLPSALALPLLAYFNYEVWVLAGNCQEALEDPVKGVKLALARPCMSEEAFVRKLTKGAPLIGEISARYVRCQEAKRLSSQKACGGMRKLKAKHLCSS